MGRRQQPWWIGTAPLPGGPPHSLSGPPRLPSLRGIQLNQCLVWVWFCEGRVDQEVDRLSCTLGSPWRLGSKGDSASQDQVVSQVLEEPAGERETLHLVQRRRLPGGGAWAVKTRPGTRRTVAGAQREDKRDGAGPRLPASDSAAVALTPLTPADRFLPVSHDFGPSCSDGPAVSHCQALKLKHPPPPPACWPPMTPVPPPRNRRCC